MGNKNSTQEKKEAEGKKDQFLLHITLGLIIKY
jgi:hypothetical protein